MNQHSLPQLQQKRRTQQELTTSVQPSDTETMNISCTDAPDYQRSQAKHITIEDFQISKMKVSA